MNKLKRIALNKILVSTLCIFLLGLFYFFPSHEIINYEIEENDTHEKNYVYLLDKDNYVSKVITYFDSNSIVDNINKRVDILINGSVDLENFYGLIPSKTKLNSVKVDKDKVYLDFNSELLKINKYLASQMIESIIYSITEINGINEVYISVENKELKELNGILLDQPLTRDFGINKEYNINSFNNINKTTIVFSKSNNNYLYYVPITKINNDNDDKIKIIIKELKSSINSQNNLISKLPNNIELVDYSISDNIMNLVFDKKLDNDSEYLISESVFENYDVSDIKFEFKK